MYRISFRAKSLTDVNMPRAMTSRSIRPNQISTWLSQEEYVGVKCSLHVRVLLQKLRDFLGLVSGEVVEDDVDLLSRLALLHDLLQEGNELFTGMPSRGFAVHL